MPYQHLIFDLDRTLWDYDTNCTSALAFLWKDFEVPIKSAESNKEVSFSAFRDAFFAANDEVWLLFDTRKITKEQLREQRFRMVLDRLGFNNHALAADLEEVFLYHCPRQGALLDGALELLDTLQPHYNLHILTNGFEKAQHLKMQSAGIMHYFDTITTSECSGFRKPEPEIFHHALAKMNSTADKAMMIGDNLHTDIAGAVAAGIQAVWYQHDLHQVPDLEASFHTIHSLSEIHDLLNVSEISILAQD